MSSSTDPVDPGKPFFPMDTSSSNPVAPSSSSISGSAMSQLPMELLHLQKIINKAVSADNKHAENDINKRRSSRAIKRKRFDDELVSPNSPSAPQSPMTNPPTSPICNQSPLDKNISPQMPPHGVRPGPSIVSPRPPGEAIGGKGMGKIARSRAASMSVADFDPSLVNTKAGLKKNKSSKKVKRTKREGAWKDLSRWKPTDDLALITAVQQTMDLGSVFRGVKFSCHFTLSEVQERWNALLYEPIISKMAMQAIKNLHPEVVLAVQKKTLYSQKEQDVLKTIKASTTPPPTLSVFEDLLQRHAQVFHPARTARCLAGYWQSLKQYTLLPDQAVQPLPKDNNILNFLDAESNINDGELFDDKDEVMDHELTSSDRRIKKEIRHLEAELVKWQVLVDKVRGESQPDFDNQTLAVLRGRLVRYLMRSKEITLGRTTKDHSVDVDLKLEGPAFKISRRQGVIKLRNTGEFFIANEGKRAIFVDGKPILCGSKSRLCNNAVLEIAGLKFVFLINQDLIEAIRQEALKMYQNA